MIVRRDGTDRPLREYEGAQLLPAGEDGSRQIAFPDPGGGIFTCWLQEFGDRTVVHVGERLGGSGIGQFLRQEESPPPPPRPSR